MKKILVILAIMMLPAILWAQKKRLHGIILERNTGNAVGNVTVKGLSATTESDSLGHFSITTEANDLLSFSHVGFANYTYKVPGVLPDTLKVDLDELPSSLDAVVVTGYTKERKKDLTGAVTIVNVDDMNKQATANPIKGLQGQVPGMFITSDGSPSGSSANIQIRGISTLMGSTQPLYIIDGVPTSQGMHELNSNDIESMQVLKDASAASIYGSRAANGVIIITTKKGKAGRMSVKVSGYTSMSDYAYRLKVLNAGGYGQALWQAAVNSGTDPNNNGAQYSFDWGLNANGQPVLNKINLPEYLDAAKTEKTSNTDWFNEVTKKGIIQNYDVTLSNGNEKGTYLFSAGYFDNKGIVKTTDFQRFSLRLNTDYKLFNNRVTIGENFSLNKTREVQLPDANLLNTALQVLPVIPVHTADGKGWGGPIGGMNDRQNPVRLLEDNKDNHYTYLRIFGNVYADVKIVDGLTFRSNYGVDYGNYNAFNFRKKYQSGYLKNDENLLTITESQTTKQNWSNTFNYVKNFNKHHVDLLAGMEYFYQYDQTFSGSSEGFDSEDLDYLYLSAGTGKKTSTGSVTQNYALFSYFGKLNYSYDNRYLASVTLRRDGSSRFGSNNRYGVFPAFSLGWRLSQEAFFSKIVSPNIVSDLKLRFGWGQTGNQNANGDFNVKNLYITDYTGGDPTWNTSLGTAYDITGAGTGTLASGYRQTLTGNPNLKWETSTMSNWGIDFGLINNAITGSVDYFIKSTKDIIFQPPYIAVLGEGGSQVLNGASMRNNGIELAMNYNGQIRSDWTYTIGANYAAYKNKVTKLDPSLYKAYGGNGTTDNIIGRPLGSFYGYVADGLFRTQQQVDESAAQTGKGLGRIRYADINHDGVITTDDQTWIGVPQPKGTYGLNLSMQYKGFDFSAFLQGLYGIMVNNVQKISTDFWSASETGSNKGVRLLNAWSLSNPNSDIPALAATDVNNESRFSSYFIENGSYTKLRNLQIGYTFPKSWMQKMKITSIRAYIGGDNLLIITKSKSFTGADPETPAYGYPNPRVFTAGFNISL